MYCTVPEVRRRTPVITEEDIADSLIEHYIEDAGKIIDGALYKMYSVPFSTAPPIIAVLAADVASFMVMRDYPDKVFKEDLARLEASYKETLADIVAGNIALIGETPSTTNASGVYFYKVTSTGERWDEQP